MLEDVEMYTGIDPSPYQSDGLKSIYETFKNYSKTKLELINLPAEKSDLKKSDYDFAITSPPYFDREKYLGGEQSHANENYSSWKNNFYEKMIKIVYDALKSKSYFALQVGSQVYPLEKDGITIAKKIGFKHIETRSTEMRNNFNRTDEQLGEVVVILFKQ